MGKQFITWAQNPGFTYKDSDLLAEMGHKGSHFFVALTQVVAEHYGVAHGMGPAWSEDHIGVEPEQFCLLVETVFLDPVDLLYPWAKTAAGMYEIIKDKRFHWGWRPDQLPYSQFRPIYHGLSELPDTNSDYMGTFPPVVPIEAIILKADNQVVARMNQRKGTLFINMGRLTYDGVTLPSGIHALQEGICEIDSSRFCKFVEASFANADLWFYVWDKYAAAMYEIIKGNTFDWHWDFTDSIFDFDSPIYSGVDRLEPNRKC